MKHGVAALAAVVSLAASVAGAVELSSDEQRRLERGEVVLVNVLPPGGTKKASQGGTVLTLVHASPGAVWQVLVDYERHAGLYPRVVDARILKADGDQALVRYVVGIGPFSFGFSVRNYPDEARRRLAWRLAQEERNDLFRDTWGYWQIDPRPPAVLVTYAMAARTVLPAFLTRNAEREGLVETVRAVRERAEHGQ
jgi:ribosome-associated toxin RatA of RatAB toxin-antitoxin module